MTGILIGYARVSQAHQDVAAQRAALHDLGVAPERVYVDQGLSGATRERPGLTTVLVACRPGDTLVVTKLDRLARSLPDARDISAELVARDVALSLGGAVHDPADPVGRLLLNVLGMVAEFERDLLRARTREGIAIVRDKGRLKGRPPKLTPAQERHLVDVHVAGTHTIGELAVLFGLGRATVYRALDRARSARTVNL